MKIKYINVCVRKEDDAAVIHFPGGNFQLVNCGESGMWAHITLDHDFVDVIDGREDASQNHQVFLDGKPCRYIKENERIGHIALKFKKKEK